MKQSVKILLIALAGVALILNVVVYFLLVDKFIRTKNELVESRAQLSQEQYEKQLLQIELGKTKEQLQKVEAELESTQRELNIVNKKLTGIEKDNLALREEKERLEAKLHSLVELKKAIRQVKLEYHQQKVQEYLARRKQQEEIDARELAQGNRGFLVKDGCSIYQPKVIIEVRPAY